MHGGASVPAGVNHHRFQHGRYSRSIPDRLAANYVKAETDPQLLSHRSSIALLETRIHELLARLDSGESGSIWKELRTSWSELQSAGDPAELKIALASLGALIERGTADETVWSELIEALHSQASLASREHARLVDLGQMVPADKVLTLAGALTRAVEDEVGDPEIRRRIGDTFRRLLNMQPRERENSAIIESENSVLELSGE